MPSLTSTSKESTPHVGCKEGIYGQIPPLIDATTDELVSGLERGNFTSVHLVNDYTDRIHRVNSSLHAVLEVNPDAYCIAAQLDRERTQGKLRGPLHGLPVLIKGNIGTRDRMQMNAGSYALQDAVLPADSTVVVKLRQKGLVILGKTSLTEWSMFRANNWGHAWNPICGQTYGAYYPRQCPGGSSSGSAVAADLGLAWATIGTEVDISPEPLTIAIVLSRVVGQTAGSIVNPSEKNNIVGIKPTVGLTSRYLVVPVSAHQDTIGPMARTVKDAASLLQAIMGTDANDFATLVSPFHERIPDYVASCKVNGLEGKRIGIARNVIEQSQPDALYTIEEFEHAIFVMKQAGATVVENTNFMAFSEWKERKYNPVTRADFVSNIAEFFKKLERNPNNIDSIESLREFTRNHPAEDYPARNTANWDVAIDNQLSSTCPEFKSLYQENLFLGGEGGILGALERHCLDAIALPTTVAFEIPALVGTPIITVPLGAASADTPVTKETPDDVVEMAPGIPFGISFLGAKWSEETLIEIAYAFEQRTAVRQCLKRSIEP